MIQNGQQAEDFIAKLYQEKGFKIIERNYYGISHSKKRGEIDILVEKNKHLHLIEVKFRSNGHTRAMEHIQAYQLSKIQKAFEIFLQNYSKYRDYTAQIDVVLVSPTKVEVIPNIHF